MRGGFVEHVRGKCTDCNSLDAGDAESCLLLQLPDWYVDG
jgi:hypothetical protein